MVNNATLIHPAVELGEAISLVNSTTTPLGAGETFTGEWERTTLPDVGVSCKADQDGTLYFDFSNDRENVDTFPVAGFSATANIHEFHTAVKLPRFYRTRYVNGSVAQSSFRVYTYFGQFRQGNLPLNASISADADAIVVRSVNSATDLALGRFGGMIEDTKHGYVEGIDAADNEVTIWQFGNDAASPRSDRKFFPTSAATLYACSSSSADTSKTFTATVILADGTKSNVEFTTHASDGQTPVSLGVSGLDVNRIRLTGEDQTHAGNIYIQQGNGFTTGAPDDPTVVLAYVEAGYGKTEQACGTVPVGKKWRIKEFIVSVSRGSGALGSANIELLTKNVGESWVVEREFQTQTGSFIKPVYGLVLDGGSRIEAVLADVSDTDTNVTFEFAYDEVDA